ncbi:MAG: ABC transporter ATP-binding protein [Acidimicrobiales bacterium]
MNVPSVVLPADSSAPVLEIDDLAVTFSTPAGLVHAVRGVSLSVGQGEVLGVVGESGCGKSVTMLATLGLLPANTRATGSVRFRGRELLGLPSAELRPLRGERMAMVFQDPITSLNPVLTVGYQVAEAIRVHHSEVRRKEGRRRAVELLSQVGIPQADRRYDDYPHQFSGGMCQRAMIAMAIANSPDLLIADEPTTALDVTIQAQILDLLRSIQAERGMAIVIISHDLGVVAGLADRVAVMYAGRVVERGSVNDVYYRCRHPYTRGLLASLPRMDDPGRTPLTPIEGSPPSLLNLPPGCTFRPRCPRAEEDCTRVEPDLVRTGAVESACLHPDSSPGPVQEMVPA